MNTRGMSESRYRRSWSGGGAAVAAAGACAPLLNGRSFDSQLMEKKRVAFLFARKIALAILAVDEV